MRGHVVINDPEGKYYPGAIVLEEPVVHQLSTRGVTLLPCDPNEIGVSGASGYVLRHWGGGWPLGRIPAMHARTVLHMRAGRGTVHWAAAVRDGTDAVAGKVDLVGDPGQGVFQAAPLTGASSSIVLPPRAQDTAHVVRGSRDASVNVGAGYALALYGAGTSRVLWLGVSWVLDEE